jgi:S1-C subfamily serine protease
VIGINAQIRSATGTGNDTGIGFAVPIDAAKHSMAQLITRGRVSYAYVGISTEDVTPSLADGLGYRTKHGALVVGVEPNSPAQRAGFRAGSKERTVLGREVLAGGDVIVEIDGRPVRHADDVVRIVSFELKPNDVTVFTIVRNGHRQKIAVTLGERRVPTG